MKRYTVIVQPTAEREIDAAFSYLAEVASLDLAISWFNQIDDALATLDRMPQRCPLAPENAFFDEEIRHLLIAPYRILFTIQRHVVHVLHVRHMAQRWLGEPDSP